MRRCGTLSPERRNMDPVLQKTASGWKQKKRKNARSFLTPGSAPNWSQQPTSRQKRKVKLKTYIRHTQEITEKTENLISVASVYSC
jgi:hypothetical protein